MLDYKVVKWRHPVFDCGGIRDCIGEGINDFDPILSIAQLSRQVIKF